MIEEITSYLSAESESEFKWVLAEKATGKQKLKVACIYNAKNLTLVQEYPLTAKKGEEVTQFGQCLHFKKNGTDHFFNVINVHLNGGKTEKDDAVRLD